MKIAQVTHTFPPYEAGTGRVCYFNAIELARLGHEVTVFTANHPPGAFEYPPEITVRRLSVPFRIGNAPLLPGLLSEVRGFDIIHLHFPFIFGAELIWLVSKLRGIPYVLTHHNDLIMVGDNLRQTLFAMYYPITKRFAVRGASKYAVVSLNHAEHCNLTPIYKRRWHDVVEISNGVDTGIFYPSDEGSEIRARWNIPFDSPIISFVGAIDSAHLFKNVDKLINAFAKLKHPDAILMIIGDGDLRQKYEQMAKQAGIDSRVIFTGKIPHDELRGYYNAANVVILPSSPPESFGMVLIEANACGRPVIASDIPGVRSVVDHGSTGYLIEPNNQDALVSKMETLINDPELAAKLGQAGLQKVTQRYSWAAIGKKLEALYEQILE